MASWRRVWNEGRAAGVRGIDSFSKTGAFSVRQMAPMPQERTIGTRAGRGDRLFSSYTSQSLKRIVHTGRVEAWAAANELAHHFVAIRARR
jgi:hypothetical protein